MQILVQLAGSCNPVSSRHNTPFSGRECSKKEGPRLGARAFCGSEAPALDGHGIFCVFTFAQGDVFVGSLRDEGQPGSSSGKR